jgi:hypothetical protein
MPSLTPEEITEHVQFNIGKFHEAKLASLRKLKIDDVLRRKNPYLYKAKGIQDAHELVRYLVDAHLSSQEETLFGEFLEQLAIFVSSRVNGGGKSSTEGIDLEFDRKGKHYIVAIKSGPNWGNASQIKKMCSDFARVRKTYHTNNRRGFEVIAINGCCYGRDNNPEKNGYRKLCGQRFWEFISGDSSLYEAVVEPIGHQAKARNEEFQEQYKIVVHDFMISVIDRYYTGSTLDWGKIVRHNSSADMPKKGPLHKRKKAG